VADRALPTRELAQRLIGDVEVLLLWHPDTNSLELALHDLAAHAGCRVAVAPEDGIDAFYHPYVYAIACDAHGEDEEEATIDDG
jgi:hypothetical protein